MTQSIPASIIPATKRRSSGRGRILEISKEESESDADAASVAFTELQKKLEAALLERDETIQQRDELARQLAAISHSVPEINGQLDESRKQLASVRRARDAAQAHVHELTDKLTASVDRAAELEIQLEGIDQELASARQQSEVFARERDDLHRAVLDMAEQRAAAVRDQQLHEAALADLQKQLVRISRERDAARATASEEAREIADLDARLKDLIEEVEARTDGDTESEALKQMIKNLEAEVARLQAHQQQAAGLVAQLTEAERNRDAAVGAIGSAQKQIEFITRERDRLRAEAAENKVILEAQVAALQARVVSLENTVIVARAEASSDTVVLEAQVAALHAQLGSIEEAAAESPEEHLEAPEVAERIREQRARLIELVAHLEAAQKKNRELTAKLAAVCGSGSAQPRIPTVSAPEPPASNAVPAAQTLSCDVLADDLAELRSLLQVLQIHPDQIELAQRLHTQCLRFSESVRSAGFAAAASLTAALAECFQWLHRTPARITPETLASTEQSFELLCFHATAGTLPALKDPATCVVYAVDDDIDNCECIGSALARFVDRTKYALQPSVALGELARGDYDLILLDVNLPEMNGFELCRRIRSLDHHAHTPIIFLSGMGSAETRAESARCGGTDYIHKPFDLHELTVRVLTQTLRMER